MKQTAVEWLVDKVEDHFCLLPVDLIKQAKEMEKEQIQDAYLEGDKMEGRASLDDAAEYYEEAYE